MVFLVHWQMPLSQATFDQSMRSLEVEPMTLVSLAPCFNAWVTGKLFAPQSSWTTTKRRLSNTWASLKLTWLGLVMNAAVDPALVGLDLFLLAKEHRHSFVYNVRYSMCCIKVISHMMLPTYLYQLLKHYICVVIDYMKFKTVGKVTLEM